MKPLFALFALVALAAAQAPPAPSSSRCANQQIGAAFCNPGGQTYIVCVDLAGTEQQLPVAPGTVCQQIANANPPAIQLGFAAPGTTGICAGRVPGQYCTYNRRQFFNCPGGELQNVAAGTLCQQNTPNDGSAPFVTLVHDDSGTQGPSYCQGKAPGQYCSDDFRGYYVCPSGEYQPMAPGTVCAYLSFNPSQVVGVFPNAATSCSAIRSANPAAGDGHYTIYHKGSPSQRLVVYCADMSTSPKEYVTLQNPSVSRSHEVNSLRLYSTFSRVRLLLNNLLIDSCDMRFRTNNIGGFTNYYAFALAIHCWESVTPAPNSVADLTGTGLRFAPGKNFVMWNGYGNQPNPVSFQSDVKYVLNPQFGSDKCQVAWITSVGTNAPECPAGNLNCFRDPNTTAGSLIPGLQLCNPFYGGGSYDYKAPAVEIVPQIVS